MLHSKRVTTQPSAIMAAWSKAMQPVAPAGRSPIRKSDSAHRLLAAENTKQSAATIAPVRSDTSTGATSGMSRSHSAGAGLAIYASAVEIDMPDDIDEEDQLPDGRGSCQDEPSTRPTVAQPQNNGQSIVVLPRDQAPHVAASTSADVHRR